MSEEKQPSMITCSGISHTFNGSQPARTAIREVNFTVPTGQFVAIIGPSGCGKSTLLRILANLIHPSRGDVRIAGLTPAEFNAQRRLGWMAQQPALLPWLTVRDNVRLAQRFHPLTSPAKMSPEAALDSVGLLEAAGAYPAALSGGMQQRLALARLISLDVDLWLMDEPFAALDELTRSSLSEELAQRWQPLQPTVLWITHNIQEAVLLADRILVFSSAPGTLIADLLVDLPRPRHPEQTGFQELVAALRSRLSPVVRAEA